MSALSDYLEGKIIDHIFRTASFTPPATLYFSLHTGATTDALTASPDGKASLDVMLSGRTAVTVTPA